MLWLAGAPVLALTLKGLAWLWAGELAYRGVRIISQGIQLPFSADSAEFKLHAEELGQELARFGVDLTPVAIFRGYKGARGLAQFLKRKGLPVKGTAPLEQGAAAKPDQVAETFPDAVPPGKRNATEFPEHRNQPDDLSTGTIAPRRYLATAS